MAARRDLCNREARPILVKGADDCQASFEAVDQIAQRRFAPRNGFARFARPIAPYSRFDECVQGGHFTSRVREEIGAVV